MMLRDCNQTSTGKAGQLADPASWARGQRPGKPATRSTPKSEKHVTSGLPAKVRKGIREGGTAGECASSRNINDC